MHVELALTDSTVIHQLHAHSVILTVRPATQLPINVSHVVLAP